MQYRRPPGAETDSRLFSDARPTASIPLAWQRDAQRAGYCRQFLKQVWSEREGAARPN